MVGVLTYLPLLNCLVFMLFGSFVHRKQLTTYVIMSMCLSAPILLFMAPAILAGESYVTSLGV